MAIERIHPIEHREVDFFDEHLARYHFAIPYILGKSVLDIGCGAGYGSYYIKKEGAHFVKGIDNSEEAIEFAKTNYRSDQLEYMRADFLSVQPKQYDVVIAYEFIEHVRDPQKYLEHMSRFVLPNGLILLSTPYIENPTIREWDRKNEFHLGTKTTKELRQMLHGLGIRDLTVWYQQKTKDYLHRCEEDIMLNYISRDLSLLRRIHTLLRRIKRVITKHNPPATYQQKLLEPPPLSLSDVEFSLFPSPRTEVVVFVCKIH